VALYWFKSFSNHKAGSLCTLSAKLYSHHLNVIHLGEVLSAK